jgi:hypothetical protein
VQQQHSISRPAGLLQLHSQPAGRLQQHVQQTDGYCDAACKRCADKPYSAAFVAVDVCNSARDNVPHGWSLLRVDVLTLFAVCLCKLLPLRKVSSQPAFGLLLLSLLPAAEKSSTPAQAGLFLDTRHACMGILHSHWQLTQFSEVLGCQQLPTCCYIQYAHSISWDLSTKS